jgi:hypothetical protein
MKEKYKILRNFFKKEKCLEMTKRLDELLQRGIYRNPDPLCTLSPAFYGIFNDELVEIQKNIETAVNEELYPCYSYARIYQKNDSLPPHTDRPSCEISLTLTLNYEKNIWPFWVIDQGQVTKIDLDVGDVLVYKGPEVMHFRHPMQGQQYQYQAFFHYVTVYGNYANCKYDLHKNLLSSLESENQNFPEWSNQTLENLREPVINSDDKDIN